MSEQANIPAISLDTSPDADAAQADPDGREVVLEARGITKYFPGVCANAAVNLRLYKGEILALLGENGAGKSTLMNIIYGLYQPDAGEVLLRGRVVDFRNPREAIHSGIGMVHQHFQLIPVMTVAENVVLGEEVTRGAFLDMQRAAARVSELSASYNLEVDPYAIVEELPVGTQQRVEIIKALYRDAEILILDEPTAVLTPQEARELFKIMRELATQGVSIIFITHKLKEVLAVADRIVAMRGGCHVGEAIPAEVTEADLAAMMVGREVLLRVEKSPAKPQAPVLEVEHLVVKDDRGHLAVNDASFTVRAGEVLGVAGVQGNGQTELVEALTGLRPAESGQVSILGQDVTTASPRAVTSAGSGHIPENRHRFGMVSTYSVAENLVLNSYFRRPFASPPTMRTLPLVGIGYIILAVTFFVLLMLVASSLWLNIIWPGVLGSFSVTDVEAASRDAMVGPDLIGLAVTVIGMILLGAVAHLVAWRVMLWLRNHTEVHIENILGGDTVGIAIDENAVHKHADGLIEAFDIRTPSAATSGGSLSGGNQQKMVVAREFSRQPKLLIAAQPTRGIDVGSIEFIHTRIIAQRDEGAAVLLVSAELDEITALSDRIVVMYKGQVVATVDPDDVTREQLGLLMAGADAKEVLRAPAEAVPAA